MKKMTELEMRNTNGGAKYTASKKCSGCGKKISYTFSSWWRTKAACKYHAKIGLDKKMKNHALNCSAFHF